MESGDKEQWDLTQSVLQKKKKLKSADRNFIGKRKYAEKINIVNIANIGYETTSARKGQATIGHRFPYQLDI